MTFAHVPIHCINTKLCILYRRYNIQIKHSLLFIQLLLTIGYKLLFKKVIFICIYDLIVYVNVTADCLTKLHVLLHVLYTKENIYVHVFL